MAKKAGGLSTKTTVTCGMLCAIAYVLTFVSHYVMPAMVPVAPWLKYDPKDIIIAVGALMFGAIPAVIMSVVVSLVEMVTISTTGIIGFAMNVISTCAFVLPAALLYGHKRKLSSAVIGLLTGTALTVVLMLLWNYLLTPLYMGWPREAVAKLLLPAFLPFNAIKYFLNTAGTLLIYKPIVTALRAAHLMPKAQENAEMKRTATATVIILSVVIIISCVLVIVYMNK